MENATFTVRFDERTKAVMVQALQEAYARSAADVCAGDYSEEALTRAEELMQVVRGVLYTRPEFPQVEEPELKEAKPDVLDNLPE